ncbi:MAG: endonuclease MutS2 [Treponema sp.]|jgi:DNA mismatch repair protein MutS2|nr:endonuclease MutS2 [Treponema sp.]
MNNSEERQIMPDESMPDTSQVDKSIIDKLTLAEKTQILLEYPQIMKNAASCAVSEEAAGMIKESKPFYDAVKAAQTKEIVSAIHTLIKSYNDEPRSWLPSIGFLLPKAETQGAVLDLDEALAIGLFIERATELTNWIIKDRGDREQETSGRQLLLAILDDEALPNCGPAAAEIFRVIDREGSLRDLPVLRAIKKRIGALEKELKTAVSRYASQDEYKRMLQSPLPSQRDGRTVLAVKANFRGRISGIVHEVSSSGQTVFIEPLDVVEKNNDILLEKRNLDAEIQKILRELTEKINAYAENLKTLHTTIMELECLRARARYSLATKGHFAKDGDGEHEALILKKARHPMLKKAVPINIEMRNSTRTLIVTGPNTGGKTVALKTLGLLAMMNQSALALPLEEGSVLPLFDGIYADIGDEQSIDQSLSTFSAHIKNISAITANATENSLVLLDELGSGTDPEEGGAIAMAVLDYLIEKKSRMIVTTHHGILKNYGYTRQGVENASVEFDARTLSPTYKIINGIPGESRALDIAAANGLDSVIVGNARKYIDEKKSDISELISGLEQKQRERAGIEHKSTMEQNRLKEEKRKADLKELQLKQKETELKRESIGKLQVFLRESRKTLENLVRELKEGEVDREKTLKVKEFLNDLARNVDIESAALDEEERLVREQFLNEQKSASTSGDVAFAPGMEVFAGPSKQRGVIVRADKKNAAGNSWIVKTGSLKISFPEKDLVPAAPVKAKTSPSWAAEYGSSGEAVFELKLLGMRLDEATEALRRQIEAAILSNLKNFSVIHGMGSGVLQKGIHDYLKNDPAVADYYFARPELGGFGRTEVVLR